MASPIFTPVELTDTFDYWRLLTNNLASQAAVGVYIDGTITDAGAIVAIDGTVSANTYTLKQNDASITFRNAANTIKGSLASNESANSLILTLANSNNAINFLANGTITVKVSANTSELVTNTVLSSTVTTINNTINTQVANAVNTSATALATALPPGAITAWAANVAPTTWAEADGMAVAVATYPVLTTNIYCGDGNNATALFGYRCTNPASPSSSRSTTGDYIVLPDLRGEVIRGWDHGRGIDIDRAFGTAQADSIKTHNHTGTTASAGSHIHATTVGANGTHTHSNEVIAGGAHTHTGSTSTTGAHAHSTSYTADNSPDNVTGIDQQEIVSGSGSGSLSTSTAGNHSHTVTIDSGGAHTHTVNITAAADHVHSVVITAAGDHSHTFTTANTGTTETRSRNISLMYIIKVL